MVPSPVGEGHAMVPELPLASPPVPDEPDRRSGRPLRHLLIAKGIVAANLGAAFGYVIWSSVRDDSRRAAALTLADYTARFESYRSHLVDSGKTPMLFYAILMAICALAAAGIYELLSRALAVFFTRTRFGKAIAPWAQAAGRWGAA